VGTSSATRPLGERLLAHGIGDAGDALRQHGKRCGQCRGIRLGFLRFRRWRRCRLVRLLSHRVAVGRCHQRIQGAAQRFDSGGGVSEVADLDVDVGLARLLGQCLLACKIGNAGDALRQCGQCGGQCRAASGLAAACDAVCAAPSSSAAPSTGEPSSSRICTLRKPVPFSVFTSRRATLVTCLDPKWTL
jgi:hypothetical protein